MAEGTSTGLPAGQSVSIHGGSFHGVTAIGQHNAVNTGPVSTGTDLDRLRGFAAELVERLRAGDLDDPGRRAAAENAETLAEELAEDDPDPKRVSRVWTRLQPALETIRTGMDFARMAGLVDAFTG